nr:hypothetical protein [Tanacetum cinerariifolium]
MVGREDCLDGYDGAGGEEVKALERDCLIPVVKVVVEMVEELVSWEDCLDGYDGAGGEEVKGGGVDLGVVKSFCERSPLVLAVSCEEWNRPSVMKGTGFCRTAENILF